VVQRYKLEVDCLNKRPNHPILLQSLGVGALQFIIWTCTLHNSHAAKEYEQVGAGEDYLIGSNTSKDFEILVLQDNVVLQELEPCCCSGPKNGYVAARLVLRRGA